MPAPISHAAPCVACGDETSRRHRVAEQMYGTGETFTYGECPSCGTLTLLNAPINLSPYYPRDYYSFAAIGDPPVGNPLRRAFNRGRTAARLRMPQMHTWIYGDKPPMWLAVMADLDLGVRSRIHDVGCGGGALLRILRREGFRNLVGSDPFADGDVSEPDLTIRAVAPSEITGRFDLVMFNHSLEHMACPVEALKYAGGALHEGGAVLVRVPVSGGFAWRHYGGDWIALDPPRHLFVPSKGGVAELAKRSGLQVRRVIYDSDAKQFWGSEQLRSGISFRDCRSLQENRAQSMFGEGDIATFDERAQLLNETEDGDTAAFVLTPL